MPLMWKRNRNPYVYNYFGVLHVGPNTQIDKIVALAAQHKVRLDSGGKHEVGGVSVDVYEIGNACKSLQEDKTRAREVLLVHPQVVHKSMDVNDLLKRLKEKTSLAAEHLPLRLVHPLAIFWFTPPPGPEVAPWPEFTDFQLVGPNDEADRQLDIVFDS